MATTVNRAYERAVSPVFISYKRNRADEVKKITEYFNLLGIPFWQDVNDLGHGQTEQEIRRILSDETISGALMFLTPDVKDSPMICKVEAPLIVDRKRNDDTFYCVPALHQMDYKSVDHLGLNLNGVLLSNWNLHGVSKDPNHVFTDEDARRIAERVFVQRLGVCHGLSGAGVPLKIGINTFGAGFDASQCFRISWNHFFKGRHASDETWTQKLLPTLDFLSSRLKDKKRPAEFQGQASLSAALALGTEFLDTTGYDASWRSTTKGQSEEVWSLNAGSAEPEINISLVGGDVGAADLAVLISLTNNVAPDFGRLRHTLSLRDVLKFEVNEGANNRPSISAARGLAIAREVVQQMRTVRSEAHANGAVHLFMAVPVAFSFVFGQLLNTFGKVVTYEYDAMREPAYNQEVVLYPSKG